MRESLFLASLEPFLRPLFVFEIDFFVQFSGKNFSISDSEYSYTVNLCSEKIAIARLSTNSHFEETLAFNAQMTSSNGDSWAMLTYPSERDSCDEIINVMIRCPTGNVKNGQLYRGDEECR